MKKNKFLHLYIKTPFGMTEGVFITVFWEELHGHFLESERRLMGEMPK